MNFKHLKQLNVAKKRVFLRADLNVPLHNKAIINDYRLTALLPTLDYLLENDAKIVLATHIGNPESLSRSNYFDENLSTALLVDWFKERGYHITYEIDLLKAEAKSRTDRHAILLIENLRFFNGEKEPKSASIFADLLQNLADCYVNDAFALMHRHDTSTTLLPQHFAPEERSIGLLVEKEITMLTKIKERPQQPYVMVLGGNKVKDKIDLLKNILKRPRHVMPQSFLIGGAMAHAFLHAQGYHIGQSIVDMSAVEFARDFLHKADELQLSVSLPHDALVTFGDAHPMEFCNIDAIPTNGTIVDIGQGTIEAFSQDITKAKTIFANGTMGIYENEFYAQGTTKILQAIADSNALSIIGGGDTVAATFTNKLQDSIGFLSTGGGATLAFLATDFAEQSLPGFKALI
ncbi:phosphoglycerate kinase [Candidatus Babeliales bacterium]|nr:phosphoglycerate kinase [Candidatus Babeliales bacterium]